MVTLIQIFKSLGQAVVLYGTDFNKTILICVNKLDLCEQVVERLSEIFQPEVWSRVLGRNLKVNLV